MSAAVAHDQPVVREVRPAATPREHPAGEPEREGRYSTILYAAGTLLLGLSIVGTPVDLRPELFVAVAVFLFALALRAAGGAARNGASVPRDEGHRGERAIAGLRSRRRIG